MMLQDADNVWTKEMDSDVVLHKSMFDALLVEKWWLTDRTKIFTNIAFFVLNTVAIFTILHVVEESNFNYWKIKETIVR